MRQEVTAWVGEVETSERSILTWRYARVGGAGTLAAKQYPQREPAQICANRIDVYCLLVLAIPEWLERRLDKFCHLVWS
jgi:hypothetical protein